MKTYCDLSSAFLACCFLGIVNELGQAEQPTYRVPQLAVGANHNLALDANGHVWVWGDNHQGQLGNPDLGLVVLNPFDLTASKIGGVDHPFKNLQIKALAAGDFHSLALTNDGKVFAWGRNADGQLGLRGTGEGTIFDLGPSGANGAYTQVVDLAKTNDAFDVAAQLQAGLIESSGALWGTSRDGGEFKKGAIYKYDKSVKIFKTMYSFDGVANGGHPTSELVIGDDGWLFGTTPIGGGTSNGCLFGIKDNGTSVTYKVLLSFSGGNGKEPSAGLLRVGNYFYGTTYRGGSSDRGTIFRFTVTNYSNPEISNFQILHHFSSGNGSNPSGALSIYDNKIYGTTEHGGPLLVPTDPPHITAPGAPPLPASMTYATVAKGVSDGTVFEFDPALFPSVQNSPTPFKTLLSFRSDGTGSGGRYLYGHQPVAGVTIDSAGNLFGITKAGGATNIYGSAIPAAPTEYIDCGQLFKLKRLNSGIPWTLELIGRFSKAPMPSNPATELLKISDTEFLGTSLNGGPSNAGTVYRVKFVGNSWRISIVKAFGGVSGSMPAGRLTFSTDHTKIYGTTSASGTDFTAQRIPKQVTSLPVIEKIAAGSLHSLALASERFDGNQYLYAWGKNSRGQLGMDEFGTKVKDQKNRSTPERCAFFANSREAITDIAANGYHSLVVRYGIPLTGGMPGYSVFAAGFNDQHQTFTSGSAFLSAFSPTNIFDVRPMRVFAGASHSMVWFPDKATKQIYLSGLNVFSGHFGTLGTGNERRGAVYTDGYLDFSLPSNSVAVGAYHNLLITSGSGTVTSWGRNNSGQAGVLQLFADGHPPLTINKPMPVQGKQLAQHTMGPDLPHVTMLAGGAAHSLFVTEDGSVLASGAGQFGQLGNGEKLAKRYFADRVLRNKAVGSTPAVPFKIFNLSADADNDDLADEWENAYFTTANAEGATIPGTSHFQNGASANIDTDGDGLTDLQEYRLGTNPIKPDTDHDGFPDGWEATHYGFNPLVYDYPNADYDGDGLTNIQEMLFGTDVSNDDTNGDGKKDITEYNDSTSVTNPGGAGGTPPSSGIEMFTATIAIGDGPLKAVCKEIQPDGSAVDFLTIVAQPGQAETRTCAKFRRDRSYRVEVNPGGPVIGQSTSWKLSVTSTSENVAIIDMPSQFNGLLTGGPVGNRKVFLASLDIVPDFDRNGVIDDKDRGKISSQEPWRWWLNNDDDDWEGKHNDNLYDQTNASTANPLSDTNINNHIVDGSCDLLDFFPLYLDIKPLLGIFPPGQAEYRLTQGDSAVNIVYTDIGINETGNFLRDRATADLLRGAATTVVTQTKVLDSQFLEKIKNSQGKGVILVEASGVSNKPLSLEVWQGVNKIASCSFPMSLDRIEHMYRWINLRSVAHNAPMLRATYVSDPVNRPDRLTSEKHVVFVHGLNNNEIYAGGYGSDVFKRLYQSGMQAKFTVVAWNGSEDQIATANPSTPDFWKNANNAFITAPFFATAVNALSGSKVIIAHSLGNMVVSSAIKDHGLMVSKYFQVDAAVALEAYDETMLQNDKMRHPDWKHPIEGPYPDRLLAANWYQLFPASDGRSGLTWRQRFGALENAYNFYSSGEDALKNSDGTVPNNPKTEQAWVAQEMAKGSNSLAVALLLSDSQAGWGINEHWYVTHLVTDGLGTVGLSLPEPKLPSETASLSDAQLRVEPFFRPFKDVRLFDDAAAGTIASDYQTRAKLLTTAIPAVSFASGSNSIDSYFTRNINMNAEFIDESAGWPDPEDRRWKHDDIVRPAFRYNFRLYDYWIDLGQLK